MSNRYRWLYVCVEYIQKESKKKIIILHGDTERNTTTYLDANLTYDRFICIIINNDIMNIIHA